MEKEIRISNNLNEIVVLASFIEELGEELSLPAETVMNINLALEEAVANIIMYAYPPKEQHIILLKVTSTEKQLIFLLTDKGASFDPTQVEEVDITLPIEERPIGGLGIFLIRSIMNEISYQRIDNENRLIMKKDISHKDEKIFQTWELRFQGWKLEFLTKETSRNSWLAFEEEQS